MSIRNTMLKRREIAEKEQGEQDRVSEILVSLKDAIQQSKLKTEDAIEMLDNVVNSLRASEKAHELDRIRHRAAQRQSLLFTLGTFLMATALGTASLVLRVGETVWIPVLIGAIGYCAFMGGVTWHFGTRKADKSPHPEMDPAYTDDSFWTFFSPTHWRWVARTNKWILAHYVVVSVFLVLLLFFIVVTVRA